MNWEIIATELKKIIRGKVLVQEPLKNHTTFRIGGPADLLVIPASIEEMPPLLDFAQRNGLPLTILGNGSNVLVKDGGIPGLVIKLGGGPHKVEISGEDLVAEAGVLMPRLARKACAHNLSGLEFMVGIPGSVGGGVVMNAGAHGQSMDQVVTHVETIGPDGVFRSIPVNALGFNYRDSTLRNRVSFVTRVHFRLSFCEKELIEERMNRNIRFRRGQQPWNWPNAGSVFVNPSHQAAGLLLETAGVKGLTRGGAQVSEKHANFIINRGEATAQDVLQLIEEMESLVAQKFGVELKREIQLLGEEL